MTHYFIKDGNKELGPFNIQQLKYKKITRETFIWYAGLTEWIAANEVYDLKVLFEKKMSPLSIAKEKLNKIFGNK